ncbi:NADPH-dependent FMN reductase [Amycolatopsis sp. 195334CR]|uniref:NADPH-dependent FMN reductase n=1 Tax=Amycolatopsis sp. 195334CR TaxID=2814588 RepID=UPI001A8C70AA|nr:NAD(P)H-dependent oxidoreductase [Amycolatopsis sp. 195334CR]MBN6040129.1 NAD(P)H-dependent oxidoreductase [Amycolatopsis sp. 195334CR]
MSQLKIAVLTASVREGRFAPVVANWFTARAALHPELAVDPVDLAKIPYPGEELSRRLAAADGVVVITPEYNHSFPGPLKIALDSVGGELRGKPVAFVSYGGLSGGLRAVEALRVVLAELHAVTVRETVSFHGAAGQFTPDGEPKDAKSVDEAAAVLLGQLVWWARALRTARATHAYGS